MQPYPINGPITIRMTADRGPHAKIHIAYLKHEKWITFREVTGWVFEPTQDVDVGVMACSPGNVGFRVFFTDIIAQDCGALAYEQEMLNIGSINPNLHPDFQGKWE
jgi:regulation of enolase protein 1 (concanavalin A-like superfamily)